MTSDLKRYRCTQDSSESGLGWARMERTEVGKWVRYEDYTALQQRLDAKWISVEERLPEITIGPDRKPQSLLVLAYLPNWSEKVKVIRFYRFNEREWEWHYPGHAKTGGEIVTYWQPLPDPPAKGAADCE